VGDFYGTPDGAHRNATTERRVMLLLLIILRRALKPSRFRGQSINRCLLLSPDPTRALAAVELPYYV